MVSDNQRAEECNSIKDLTREELEKFCAEIVRENGRLQMRLRQLKIDLDEIRKLVGNYGFTERVLEEIRLQVLTKYVGKIFKRGKGRPVSFGYQADLAAIFHEYELQDDPLPFKTWIRQVIIEDYKRHNVSIQARAREIERIVQKIATEYTRRRNRYLNKS
jgi:hypothetical protein